MATAIRSGPARTVTSAPPWESRAALPPWNAAIQWGSGECTPALQQNRHGISPRRGATLGAGGVLVCSRLGCSRGQALRGIGEDAAQKLNQAASASNPGRASPQELFTGKKGAFLVVPFFQYGFMYRERRSKLDDKAVPCYFLNAGDNHADWCVKVPRADTGRVCYSSNNTWAPLPQSGGGEVQYCSFRASTAHAAGGVIQDCIDAACRCRYPSCRDRLAAARHCR